MEYINKDKQLFEEDESFINEEHIKAFIDASTRDVFEWHADKKEKSTRASSSEQQDQEESEENRKESGNESESRIAGLAKKMVNKARKRGKAEKETPRVDEWDPKIEEMLFNDREYKTPHSLHKSYELFRRPMLLGILLGLFILCIVYGILRATVALLEYLFAWRGERKKIRDRLRNAKSYEEWVQRATELDNHLGLDKWSSTPEFPFYDYKAVQMTMTELRRLRESNEDSELMTFLQQCLIKNYAGVENKQLYSHRYFGTKNLVQEYIEEVVRCVDTVRRSEKISLPDKRKFFRTALKSYGNTALCLSGGACFAYMHFGIVKALLHEDLLPSIISGTSAGGLVAALVCSRTDEELKELLVPQLAKKITACEDPWYVWLRRWWHTGARFDSVSWARKACFFTRGSLTFEECYRRTGRKLNIPAVPTDQHLPAILCNNITALNCIVWSSILASAAVPGILNPVVLMAKKPHTNKARPFSLASRWRDGSLRTDIPIDALKAYYNVSFCVVSQVNPHILLFMFAPKGTVGKPVVSPSKTKYDAPTSFRGGFFATALELIIRLEITKWLHVVKSLDLLPRIMQQDWLDVWLQKFSGSITVWPRNTLKDFWYILSDPTEKRLEQMMDKGQRAIFPKMLFLKNRLFIERAIESGRKETHRATNSASAAGSRTTSISPERFQSNVFALLEDHNEEGSSELSDVEGENFTHPFAHDGPSQVRAFRRNRSRRAPNDHDTEETLGRRTYKSLSTTII